MSTGHFTYFRFFKYMLVTELQILSEALWEAVKSDLKFFASIQSFVKKLAEVDYSNLSKQNINLIKVYTENIERFFANYRSSGHGLYIPPTQTDSNDATVVKINSLVQRLQTLDDDALLEEAKSVQPEPKKSAKGGGAIFIGHGRSRLWARLQLHLRDDYGLQTLAFETESHAGETIVNILEGFLDQSSFAILIMTAEDETGDGKLRARQNVIHEAGLFQGRLGFRKVILLKQAETEEFSNVAGLQYIGFSGDNIEQTFYELGRALKRNGLIK